MEKSSFGVLLAEGELDAIYVAQTTFKPAVSLPNVTSFLPMQILLTLERFR